MSNILKPSAPILATSLRAFGYSLETSIADLIDNSISADAENIWVDFYWNGAGSAISISDDGLGIEASDIDRVMTFGSQSPDQKRKESDLGRFGLGLKTASLSQAKSFTICSKTSPGTTVCRQWDLDYIKEADDWAILTPLPDMSSNYYIRFAGVDHGTTVLWEKIDKVVEHFWQVGNINDENKFIASKIRVRDHLAMVFHRFLEGINPKIKLYVDGVRVEPWDPFFETHNATDRTPEEPIPFGESVVVIKGFVLPHKDKLTEEEYEKCKGPKGWNGQQGFYIYRNKRMLIGGSWLGLGDGRAWTKEEQYKLARIRIDIPNSLDAAWDIDVKKSTAKPPQVLRRKIVSLAQDVRKKAREVFAHRGQYKKRSKELEFDSIWRSNVINGKRNYFLDRNHPLIHMLRQDNIDLKALESLLKIIEQTVPVERIWLETAEEPENHARAFDSIGEDAIREVAAEYLTALTTMEGYSKEEAIRKILDTDGFRFHADVIKSL